MTDSTDAQSKIAAACTEHLDRRTEWDEAPEILGLFGGDGRGLRLEQFPVPMVLWEAGPPAVMFGRYARAVVAFEVRALPDLVAVAFRYEAFALSEDLSPQAAEVLRRRKAGGSVPRNEHVPGRIEQRIVSAVDTQGHHYMITADRMGDGSAAPAVSKLIPKGEQVTGRIPDALNELIEALHPHAAARRGAFGAGER
ncbi:hypothetical protein ACTPOK_29655 [Streptomyces inhibens]|uniref:hypothetical protein n=1 Tax=Streptomyces inhibens TaxID=2293571 RepID=UPI00402AB36C